MGLQSQLNDVSSDSIPLLFVALIANSINYLRSFLLGLLQSMGLTRFNHHHHHHHNVDEAFLGSVGSGLAGLIVLADQLNLNRALSYQYCSVQQQEQDEHEEEEEEVEATGSGSEMGRVARPECVVCLSSFRDGDQVRKLDCCHVFHKDCFDGWLDHLNFNCPLCRSPLVSDQRVPLASRRVGGDLLAWFSSRWSEPPHQYYCWDGALSLSFFWVKNFTFLTFYYFGRLVTVLTGGNFYFIFLGSCFFHFFFCFWKSS